MRRIAGLLRFSVKDLWIKSQNDQIFVHASSLAFTSVLSFIPMFAMAYFFLDAFGGLDSIQGRLQEFVVGNLAPSFGQTMMTHIQGIRENISSGALGIFGLIGFIYTSISMLAKIEASFNIIWIVEKSRPWSMKVTQYWTMMTLGPILLGASFYLSSQFLSWLQGDKGEIAKVIIAFWSVAPYFTSSILFAALYFFLPAKRVSKRSAFLAGVFTGTIFEVAKGAYASYAANSLGKSVYGSLAALPVLLVWIQLIWIIVLFGAQFCYLLDRHYWLKSAKTEGSTR